MWHLRHAVLIAVLLAWPIAAAAQEVQVPLDREGALEEMDGALARRLGLFVDEYPGLVAVRLFQRSPSEYVLEITTRREGRTVRQRVEMNAPEVARMRDRISRRIAESAPQVVLNQDGRHLLVGTTTLLGLGYWGWSVPAILDINDGRLALGTYMLTAGASFLVPYQLTKRRPVTWGMANAARWGATRGVLHGVLLHHLLEGDAPASTGGDGWSGYERRRLGAMLLLSLGETVAAYGWAAAGDMSAGDAHTIGNGGDFGMAWGAETALLLGLEGNEAEMRATEALVLAGSGAGLVAGAALARTRNDTWGDAEIVRAGHLVGALAGTMVAEWIDPGAEHPRVFGGGLLAGSVAGTYLGMKVVEDRDFSVGQGILVDLGSAAGGLIGLGIAVLAVEGEDATPFLTLATAGATVGFLATAASLADDARHADDGRDGSLRLELSPVGLTALLESRPAGPGGRPAGGRSAPLLGVRYTF